MSIDFPKIIVIFLLSLLCILLSQIVFVFHSQRRDGVGEGMELKERKEERKRMIQERKREKKEKKCIMVSVSLSTNRH